MKKKKIKASCLVSKRGRPTEKTIKRAEIKNAPNLQTLEFGQVSTASHRGEARARPAIGPGGRKGERKKRRQINNEQKRTTFMFGGWAWGWGPTREKKGARRLQWDGVLNRLFGAAEWGGGWKKGVCSDSREMRGRTKKKKTGVRRYARSK